ncbi:MAG: holotricin-3 [Raoultibacter sp.]
MSDENRRAGDWQRKSQREDANDLMRDPNEKPWYRQVFWIIFFLLIFWPVGIVLCWQSNWHIALKILASVFVVLSVFISYNMWQVALQMGIA